MNFSKADKEFNILEFAKKQLLAKNIEHTDDGFMLQNTYSKDTDGFIIYPKELTNAQRDEVTGDKFKEINPKHEPYMRYGATQFLRLIYGESKEQAKNRALKLIKDNYEDKPQEEESQYLLNRSGAKLKVYENLKVLLKQYGISVRFNELNKRIEIDGCINVQGAYDSSITKLNTLCQLNELKLSKDQQYDFMYCVAIDNKFNSVVEYLESCRELYLRSQPTEPVINSLFNTIEYTNANEIEFNNKILFKAMLGYIHMAYNTGTSFVDFFIVLKGKQGIGKTQWIKSLIPKRHLNEFFKEGVVLKLGDKDSIIQNTCYWIVELGEFGKTLRESDRDEMKAFICKSTDEYRVPYARTQKAYPRHTLFIATVNDEEFLRDVTGDRRYAVFEVDKLDFKHNIDIDMLWGELMVLYESGKYTTFLTNEEMKEIVLKNRKFTIRSNEQILLEEYLPLKQPKEQWRPVTVSALAKYIEDETGRKLDCRRLGKAMRANGYEQKRIGHEGIRTYIAPYIKDVSLPF